MTAKRFDEALELRWPMTLPPVAPGGSPSALYFSTLLRNGAEQPVCVLATPRNGSEGTRYAHGTRARVVGLYQTIRGTLFVVCRQIHADAAPSVSVKACVVPNLLWPVLVFGATIESGLLARVQPGLHVIDVVVQRRRNCLGTPVTIRCAVDPGEAELPPNSLVVLRGRLSAVGLCSFTIDVRTVHLENVDPPVLAIYGLRLSWLRDLFRRRGRSISGSLAPPGSLAQITPGVSELAFDSSPAKGAYPRVVVSTPGPLLTL